MPDLDTSILDELDRRHRREALRARVKPIKPKPVGRAKPGPKPKAPRKRTYKPTTPRPKGQAVADRRQREGDEIAAALLSICTRLAAERGIEIPTNNGGTQA